MCYSGSTAGDCITAGIVAGVGACGNGPAGHRNSAVGSIVRGRSDVIGNCTAGGRIVAGRNIRIKQVKCQFRVVHEHIPGTCDGLNSIISAQFPSVNRVFLHPFQKNFLALHNAGSTPHIAGIAPTDINIQHNTGHITMEVIFSVRLIIGIIVAAGFTESFIATTAVFGGGCGSKHHNIIFVLTAQALTVRPGMLPVPGAAFTPTGTNRSTGIKAGNFAATILAVGVLIQVFGCIIAGFVAMSIRHQCFQLAVKRTGRHRAGG